ncbi:MAG: SRPBCC family protein [Planctomycetota bacterium]|jgi:carbon monoxide dehydrogenase subunit G
MGTLTMDIRINASPDVVFDVFTDLENAAERIDGIKTLEVLTEGPVGVGTRFRETRIMFRKEATEEMEFTAFDAGRSYVVEAESCGSHYRSEYRFEPCDEGTDVHFSFDAKPLTFFAKALSPVGMLMMGGMMRKLFRADMIDLKAVAEQRAAAPG